MAVLVASAVGLLTLLALDVPLTLVAIPLMLMRSADSLLDVTLAHFQARSRFRTYFTAHLVNSILTVVLILASFILSDSWTLILWASAIASITTSLIVWQKMNITPQPGIQIGTVCRRMVPLGVSTGLGSVLVYIPVYMLSAFGSSDATGLYGVLAQVVTIANLALVGSHHGLLPRLAAARRQGIEALKESRRHVWIFSLSAALVLAALVAFATPPLLPVVFGNEFAVSFPQVLPLALSILSLAMTYLGESTLVVLGEYGVQFAGAAVALCVSVVLALTLEGDTVLLATTVAAIGYASRAIVTQMVSQHHWKRTLGRHVP